MPAVTLTKVIRAQGRIHLVFGKIGYEFGSVAELKAFVNGNSPLPMAQIQGHAMAIAELVKSVNSPADLDTLEGKIVDIVLPSATVRP